MVGHYIARIANITSIYTFRGECRDLGFTPPPRNLRNNFKNMPRTYTTYTTIDTFRKILDLLFQ